MCVDGSPIEAHVLLAAPDRVEIEIEGVRREVRVERIGDLVYADSSLGSTVMRVVDRFPDHAHEGAEGSLRAPLPGTVTRVLVREGDDVLAGQPLLALEAMKMEHTISAAHDGVVNSIAVAVGDQVEPTTVLLVIAGPEAGS